jgi:hypothetical protein
MKLARVDMAAVFTQLQAGMYRLHEEDYLSSLEAERRALTLAQTSPSGLDPSLCWMNIGQDLYRLGRNFPGRERERSPQELRETRCSEVYT